MMNVAYLVAEGAAEQDPRVLGRELSNDISRLSGLVKELLALPLDLTRAGKTQIGGSLNYVLGDTRDE